MQVLPEKMSGCECAANPANTRAGSRLWGFKGDHVKSTGHIDQIWPMLQKKLRRSHDTLLLAGVYRTCGAVKSTVTACSDFYKDQMSAILNNEVDFTRFPPEVTFQ